MNAERTGLTQAEAARRLLADGPNAVTDVADHPLRNVLRTFWAPVPWLLEAAAILELVLHELLQSGIVLVLLAFNAGLSYVQSSRAQATLAALKSRLALNASVRRDGVWAIVPARTLVRDDIIKLSLGGVVPADARIVEGDVLLDQSMLTGESVPAEAGAGAQAYAGALIRRGEATATVTATGSRTKFGRTAELVRDAGATSTQEKAVLLVVRNLALFGGLVIVVLVIYGFALGLSSIAMIGLVLTAILGSIPVALPATFTLAAAVGARSLAAAGILPTRLSAVDEAASMTVLCCDKTGTLTLNALGVAAVQPLPGTDEAHLLALAALASSEGGNDPVDAALRAAANEHIIDDAPALLHYLPFDSAAKMSEALVAFGPARESRRVIKGAYATVSALARPQPEATAAATALEEKGYRVLAVAWGPTGALQLAGLIALSDPPRPDAAALIRELDALGVQTLMVTGDAPATARNLAAEVGLAAPVHAGVLPEEKFRFVQTLQASGRVVGMCGDGANDAPALRQAHMGIAVSSASDVAKSAAGIVLTTAGLGGIVAAVKEGRITFQRILTYTLNSIVKKFVTGLLLVVGLLMTGHPVLTPMLMILLMVAGDFPAMSLTTDNVTPSARPNVWHIRNLTIAGGAIGACLLTFCSAALAFGAFRLRLPAEALQTLAFVSVAFGTQATIFAIRERHHFFTWPSRWLVVASTGTVAVGASLAVFGVLMAPLPWSLVGELLAAAALFGLALDVIKLPLFRRWKLS